MFIEYATLIGAKFGLDTAFVTHIAWIMLYGLALTGAGFAVKGVFGAIVALGLGVIVYLYWNRMLPF